MHIRYNTETCTYNLRISPRYTCHQTCLHGHADMHLQIFSQRDSVAMPKVANRFGELGWIRNPSSTPAIAYATWGVVEIAGRQQFENTNTVLPSGHIMSYHADTVPSILVHAAHDCLHQCIALNTITRTGTPTHIRTQC